MDVGNGDTWNGDWDGLDRWVQGLFPNPHHLADDEEEDADPPEWPNTIEIHVGSRGVSSAPEKRVDVAALEPVDAMNIVAVGVQEVLNSRAGAHTSVVIKLTATTQDEEGKEGEWAHAGNVTRVFNRAVTVHTTTASPPRVPSPTPSPPAPWASPPAPWASPPAAPPPVAPIAVPGYAPPAAPGAPQAVPFSSPQGTPDLGTQALLFAFQSLQANAANLMAEHRFLIDQNTAMVDRVISVHEAAVQGMAREASASRTSMERLNSEMMGLHRDTMTAQAETERVRLEADKRAESLERNRVDNENAALRENLTELVSRVQGMQEEAATQDQDDPGSDPIRAQVAGAASQVLNAVLAELAGQGKKEEGTTPNQPNNATQETNQETAAPRRRRRRRPGVPGVRPVDADPEPPPPEPNSGGDGLGFDISNVTPQQAAMVLSMLPEDTRKSALQTLVSMNRALAIQMGTEFADAVDAHDGV